MTNKDKLLIDFYKNGGAQKVLNRYEFTDEERRLINKAILSAKRPRPNLALIKEADAMLQEVVSLRQPLSSETVFDDNSPASWELSFFARHGLDMGGQIKLFLFLTIVLMGLILLITHIYSPWSI